MFLRPTTFQCLGLCFIIGLSTSASSQQQTTPATAQDEKENDRSIIADEFLKNRRPGKTGTRKSSTYRVVKAATRRSDQRRIEIGVTIWRLDPGTSFNSERSFSGSSWNREEWKRVEPDVKFREGELIRLSIESPRDGYVYVVNRDWLADGTYGETNLIFPKLGEDNRLKAGKLIDIPAQNDRPFKATPKPNQSSELLTIIVTSLPLNLPLSTRPIPVSAAQLRKWEQRWGGEPDRLEMNGGAGQIRTEAEQLAASPARSRQLTREDPTPQTIYSFIRKNPGGLLFNLVLFYDR